MNSLTATSLSHSLTSQLSPDEMKLLAKLEEQNRMLEKDSKSLSMVNGVLQEDTWSYVVKEWDDWSKNKVRQLKELIRRGIPAYLRSHLWQLLCDAQNVEDRQRYPQLLETSSHSETLIRRDMTRILPQHRLFQSLDSTGQEMLFNVLKAYSVLDQEIGYCQGSMFVVGLLITQMCEEEAFCVFVRLMKDFQMRELYRSTMAELGCCIYQLDYMIQDQLPQLHSHFQTQGFQSSMFSSSWFLHILLSSLPVTAALRIFDIFMCEGLEIVFRVGLAMLHLKQAELIKLDVEGIMQNLAQQDLDPDSLIKAAYQIQYNTKIMKELRKDYTSIKTKELEDQEELNGLYSENKLLKQRLDMLQKRCSENLVSQLERDLKTTLQNAAMSYNTLKEMKAEILQMENSAGSDEDSLACLQTELISCRLQEAEALTGIKELKLHVKYMEEKLKHQQVHCGGQQKSVSVQNILQVDLLSARLKETLSKAALIECRHKLLQLQTENELHSNQLKLFKVHVNSQRERLQDLTLQNQHLQNQVQQSRRPFIAAQHKLNYDEKQKEDAEDMAVVADLQKQTKTVKTQDS